MPLGAPRSAKSHCPRADEAPGRYEFVAQLGNFPCRCRFRSGSLVEGRSVRRSDVEVMRLAAAHNHIVLTADLDFGAILAATQRRRPSVIQIRADVLTPAAVGAAVLSAIRQMPEELAEGAIISLDAARARLRVLPFNPQ
jgi:predicted nuclease of predicted toxin-antitoxin system